MARFRLCSPRRKCTALSVGLLGLLVALVLLAFLAFAHDTSQDDQKDLLLVNVLFRHGDRTPLKTYPTDPYQGDTWPEGFGALTKEGKMQLFSLGEYLRKRYGRFLGNVYRPDIMRVVSSDVDRTIMSAQCLLAGLLPPAEEQRWNPDLEWQPIPVHVTPQKFDNLIIAKKPCPAYQKALKEAYESPEIQKLNEENKDLYDYLSEHTGQEIKNITAVEFLYDTLKVEKAKNLKLPEWTDSVFPESMEILTAKSLAIFTYTDAMKRARVGPLIKELTDHIQAKTDKTLKSTQRMFLYSIHDVTLVGLRRALGLTDLIKPEYGASLIIELRWIEQGENLHVKVLYLNSSSSTEPVNVEIPGCGQICDVFSFLSYIKKFVPSDWEKECELPGS